MSKTYRYNPTTHQRRPTLFVVEQFNAATGQWHVTRRARHQGKAEKELRTLIDEGHKVRIAQS